MPDSIKVATLAVAALVAMNCGGQSDRTSEGDKALLNVQEPSGAQGPSIDQRSYRLGSIGAFAEMVDAGVKKLALSAALEPGEMEALLEEAEGDTRQEYMELKAEKLRLEELGEYGGQARREIAHRFGALLSYSEEKIEGLLEKGT